jgi:hypothetical protein
MSKKKSTALANPMQQQLGQVHPIHAQFLQAFEELGGIERMKEWADENYTDFMKIFSRMAPRPQTEINAGRIEIVVHSSLKPSALDG